MKRRTFLAGVGVAAATAATAGTVSARNSAIAWESDLAPSPRFPNTTVTVDTVTNSMGPLDFTNNDGETESLSNYGARITPAVEASSNDQIDFEPHNPVSIRPDRIKSSAYSAFPRDTTREDADGNTVDVSALDSREWSGSMAVSDDGDALSLTAGAAGDSATFDLTTHSARLSSGAERRVIFAVASVSSLGGSSVEISVSGSGGSTVTETLATATGSSVTQTQIGDLSGASNLDGIDQVTITAVGGSASLTLHGLDVERQSILTLGVQEQITQDSDGNDQIEEIDLTEPSGRISIMSLDSIEIGYSAIEKVKYDVEIVAGELPPENVMIEFSDAPSARSVSRRMKLAVEFEIPSAFDLSWSLGNFTDTAFVQSSQILAVKTETDTEIPDLDNPTDLSDTATEETSGYGTLGEDVSLSAAPSPGVPLTISYDTLLTSDQESALSSSGGFLGAGGGGSGGGGGLAGLGDLKSFVMVMGGIGATLVAWLRARGRSLR